MSVARIAFLLLLLAAPVAAQQQDDKLEPPDLERYRRWGFLRARPGVELTNLGYDSNILSTSTGEKVSDTTATISPKLEGLVLFGSKAFLTFYEQFDYTLYLENGDQNFWSNSFETRATIPLGKFGVFVEGAYDDLRLRPIDQEDIRTESKRRELGFGVILQPGWRTEIELAQYGNRWRYDDPQGQNVSERLDRDETWTRLDVDYDLGGRTRLLLRLENKKIEFLSPFDTGTALVQRDTDERRGLAGFRLGRGSTLTGHLLLGRSRIDAEDPALQDLDEFIGELRATWIAGNRTRVTFVGERTPGFAVSDSNAYYLDTFGSIRTVHYFTRLVGGEVSARRGRLEFPEALVGTTRKDETSLYQVGVRLRLLAAPDGRRVEYSLTVGRYNRDSNLPGFDQEKTTFGFGAVLGF